MYCQKVMFLEIFYPVCILKMIIALSLLNIVSCTPQNWKYVSHVLPVLIFVVFPLSPRLWLYIHYFIPFPLNLELAILAQFSQVYFLNFYPFNNFSRNSHLNVCMCVWCSAGSRSGSPGRVLTTTALSTVSSGVQRVLVNSASAQKRSKIPRSQGCSREASPSRLSVGKTFYVGLGTLYFFCVSGFDSIEDFD